MSIIFSQLSTTCFSGGAGVDMVWQGIYLAFVEIAAYFIGFYLETGSFHVWVPVILTRLTR